MNKEQCREEFEKWAFKRGFRDFKKTNYQDEYNEVSAQIAWEAWQARAELDKQDTSEIVAELDARIEYYRVDAEYDIEDKRDTWKLLTKIRKHLTND